MPAPREIPLLKLALALIAGILIQPYLDFSYPLIVGLLFLTIAILVFLNRRRGLGLLHLIRSGMVYVVFILLGMIIHTQRNETIRYPEIDQRMYEPQYMRLTCESIPQLGKTAKFYAKVDQIGDEIDCIENINAIKVLVNVRDLNQEIAVGDQLLVKSKLSEPPRSRNPKAFDYSKYLHRQGIGYQTYFNGEDIHMIKKRSGLNYFVTGELRNRAIGAFSEQLSGENLAIASALVLGYRDLISDDLYSTFTDTGSMHVLAVSGLHVGILTTFLGFLLSFFRQNSTNAKVIKAVVLVSCVILFALLTGWSPSVVRASIMFSILEVSKISRGHYSVYNSIGASILLMLLIDPYNLYQVGFQLSFSAIISIIVFYPWIYGWFSPGSWVVNRIWQMVCIALSVQILTFPIAMHYFHQFPVYFFITGISAVFLAMLILGVGLIALVSSALSLHIPFLFDIFDGLISALVMSTRWVEKLPFGLVENIHFDQFSVLLTFGAILCLSTYFLQAQKKGLIIGLGMVTVLMMYRAIDTIAKYESQQIIVYDTRYPMVDILIDDVCYSYADERLNDKNIKYASENHRISRRVNKVYNIDDLKDVKRLIIKNRHLFSEDDYANKLRSRRNESFGEEIDRVFRNDDLGEEETTFTN